jgi:2-polyprenyl-3-methyl-5-hydroxy-6-metoxy-1,4-benzoquinol methylase
MKTISTKEDAAHFDEASGTWDQPHRLAQSLQFFNALRGIGFPGGGQRLMDYGCGTGLLSIPLAQTADFVYAVDSSQGMLEVVDQKVCQGGLTNVKTCCIDLSVDSLTVNSPLDGIVTAMALHHVVDLETLFACFFDLLRPGGMLVVFDLEKEDGSFHRSHGGAAVPHHGFRRYEMEGVLKQTGFSLQSMERLLSIRKDVDGEERDYPVFMLVAER